jgi:GNAT superfamily N-acetyltransferase
MGSQNDNPKRFKSESALLKGGQADRYSLGIASPGLGGLADKILRNLDDYGWRITIHKTLAYLVRSVYFRQVYRIYRINLAATKPLEDSGKGNFTFKILTAQDASLIAQVENIAEWLRRQLQGKIAAGQLCLVALDGEQVAGFNLINFEQATLVLVNLQKKLRHGFAWSEHVAVKKEFRRTGLASQLRYRIFEELKRRGIRRLYGGTLRSNTASLRLTRSVGFKEIGDIYYRKFFSIENWQYKRIRG